MQFYQKLKNRILPHELAWLLFLFLQTILLIFYAKFCIWTFFSLLSMVLVVSVIFCHNSFIRLGIYVVFMNGMFTAIRYISPLINPKGHLDEILNKIDIGLFGKNLSIALEPFSNPIFTEVLSLAYMLFMVQIFLSFCWYLCQTGEVRQRVFVGVMMLYAFGYIGYILVPAYGPYLFLKNAFSDPLNAGIFRDLLNWSYPKGTNYSDVFPSLHCGVSLFFLIADYFYHKKFFKIWLPICILIWISTIYLRYHYMIDCIVGFILSIGCLYFMKHYHYKKGESDDKRFIF